MHKFEESRNHNGFIRYFYKEYSAVIKAVLEKVLSGE